MPLALSSYAQSGLMYHIFLGQNFPMPSALAFALAGPVPTNTSFTEVANVNGYARVAVNPGSTNWNYFYPTSGLVFNVNSVTFPTATGYIGWASGLVITDSSLYGSGNVWFYTSLSSAKEIAVNDSLTASPTGIYVRMS